MESTQSDQVVARCERFTVYLTVAVVVNGAGATEEVPPTPAAASPTRTPVAHRANIRRYGYQ